ncbi:FadR/GntR family transcriptional regulator [Salipiger mucosus]|uniref:Putative D-glucarate or D-galactorate regulator, GntR family n=1 Tax=Salipiger mucosus DSM 16094 TaxID=1123237 RepID=S9RBI0_9RHOB|nr:FadR/GntR family transcriptional regulator [Salipiger mucosus]EPX75480.1 putative D-glucarate or D-galactorate regulator, GntR family [Salipiger mucosus DSM 16094]
MDTTRKTETTAPGRTLVERVRDALRGQIVAGTYPPGSRLPSEAQLTRDFEVSRTVIREAVASLRADGLVAPRQGAGVFVLDPPAPVDLPFQNIDFVRLSSMIELLELRTAVEGEAAALAAQRRSPAQEEKIIGALREVTRAARAGEPTMEADFALHLAIAEASNNPRFGDFLSMIGSNMIPRRALTDSPAEPAPPEYLDRIATEHEAIVNAVLDGDEEAAREAMRSHLKGSQARYRALLRAGTATQ